MKKPYGFDTLQIHAGQEVDPTTKSRAVPIYQTTSYVFDDSAQGNAIFNLEQPGNIYTRIMNPTTDVLEKRLAALEGGCGALAVSSGMAAILYAVLNLAQPGDEIVSLATVYGGTHTLFHERLKPQYGIEARLIDPEDLDGLKTAINDKTRLVYLETLGNPSINIPDFDAIAAIAHAAGVPVVADNTFGTPYLIQLKDHGVDFAVHSLTKYIGGHGTSIGGALVDYGTFDFKGNPRFPQYNEPDEAYHGFVYADIQPGAFITRARVVHLRDTGACISPFNAFLLLQGMETLSLRVERHTQNALAIAQHLEAHPAVTWVNHPGLPSSPYYERQQRYLPKGVGGIFTFGVKGGKQAAIKFIDSLELFSLLANVADAKSLAIHPAGTTHAQLSDEALAACGVLPEMVRLSIGLEEDDDLLADIDQALEASQR